MKKILKFLGIMLLIPVAIVCLPITIAVGLILFFKNLPKINLWFAKKSDDRAYHRFEKHLEQAAKDISEGKNQVADVYPFRTDNINYQSYRFKHYTRFQYKPRVSNKKRYTNQWVKNTSATHPFFARALERQAKKENLERSIAQMQV